MLKWNREEEDKSAAFVPIFLRVEEIIALTAKPHTHDEMSLLSVLRLYDGELVDRQSSFPYQPFQLSKYCDHRPP